MCGLGGGVRGVCGLGGFEGCVAWGGLRGVWPGCSLSGTPHHQIPNRLPSEIFTFPEIIILHVLE